jgi:hypothetical protein
VPDWLTLGEAATLVGAHPQELRKAIDQFDLKAEYAQGPYGRASWQIAPADLLAWDRIKRMKTQHPGMYEARFAHRSRLAERRVEHDIRARRKRLAQEQQAREAEWSEGGE